MWPPTSLHALDFCIASPKTLYLTSVWPFPLPNHSSLQVLHFSKASPKIHTNQLSNYVTHFIQPLVEILPSYIYCRIYLNSLSPSYLLIIPSHTPLSLLSRGLSTQYPTSVSYIPPSSLTRRQIKLNLILLYLK